MPVVGLAVGIPVALVGVLLLLLRSPYAGTSEPADARVEEAAGV